MAYVIAHEVGHHIQNLSGTFDKAARERQNMSEKAYNKLSVKMELQADFYAGVWANRNQKMKQFLESGDLESALNAANAIGDDRLQEQSTGRIVPDAELARLHCLFPDRYFGEMIFLLREGVLIVPSHMGERPIRAMHGYHPDERHSYAALLTNQPEIPDDITAIPHIYQLMVRDALLAQERNGTPRPPESRPVRRITVTEGMPEPILAFSAQLSVPKI